MNELLDQIKIVAELRKDKTTLDNLKKESMAKWQEDNNELLAQLELGSTVLAKAEDRLRDLTIKAYNETGNKKLAEGVGIREVTRLEYDQNIALNWAREHDLCLMLDKKRFETLAKTNPVDFVTIKTETQATISPDLKVETEEE